MRHTVINLQNPVTAVGTVRSRRDPNVSGLKHVVGLFGRLSKKVDGFPKSQGCSNLGITVDPPFYCFGPYSAQPSTSNLSTFSSTPASISDAYRSSRLRISRSDAPSIRAASSAALTELLMATVATGTPRYPVRSVVRIAGSGGFVCLPAFGRCSADCPFRPKYSPSQAHQ